MMQTLAKYMSRATDGFAMHYRSTVLQAA